MKRELRIFKTRIEKQYPGCVLEVDDAAAWFHPSTVWLYAPPKMNWKGLGTHTVVREYYPFQNETPEVAINALMEVIEDGLEPCGEDCEYCGGAEQ